jgi:ribose transport system substrate-binding protein
MTIERRPFLLLILAAVALICGGCTGSGDKKRESPAASSATPGASSPAGNSPSTEKPQVALIMKSLANEFFQTMQKGAEAHQKAHEAEYTLIANGIKDETDVAKQQQLVEQMMAQQVSAIVIAPADSKAMVLVCKQAMDAGIPVVNIDNRFDADVLKDKKIIIPFVGPDNRKGARLAGEYLAKKLKPGDKVAIIEGAPNAFNAVQRKLGFEDAMKEVGATIVTSQSGNWETEQANHIASAILTANPDIKALLCANDSMALGALSAIKAAEKEGQVLVVGFDNISAVHQLIKDGKVLCTVDQHGDQLAVYGVEYALDMIAKKTPPADKETPVDLITAENIK